MELTGATFNLVSSCIGSSRTVVCLPKMLRLDGAAVAVAGKAGDLLKKKKNVAKGELLEFHVAKNVVAGLAKRPSKTRKNKTNSSPAT